MTLERTYPPKGHPHIEIIIGQQRTLQDARVLHRDELGNTTDISSCIFGYHVDHEVGKLAVITLRVNGYVQWAEREEATG